MRSAPVGRSGLRRQLKRGKGSFISRGDRAREAQQWDLAADFYRKALDRNPDNAPIWVQYGHALKEHGDVAAAESAYRAAIRRDPRAADPYLQLGHVLKMQGRQQEARVAYLGAVARDRSLSQAFEELRGLGWSAEELDELHHLTSPPPAGEWLHAPPSAGLRRDVDDDAPQSSAGEPRA